ncbi:putative C-type lectin domain family 20 member A isoform X2 [Lepisosteus oculatus]|uniref:putative C-type lectin domain family 20 member A isoform X2 n=1 Tax=Lepisosteus oculatus TaxID=7918 RepID=UPI0035F51595
MQLVAVFVILYMGWEKAEGTACDDPLSLTEVVDLQTNSSCGPLSIVQKPLDWNSARCFCQKHFTDLAVLSPTARRNVQGNISKDEDVLWIGLEWRNTSYVWIDNTVLNESDRGDLKEDSTKTCVILEKDKWYPEDCANTTSFLCCGVYPTLKPTGVRTTKNTVPTSPHQTPAYDETTAGPKTDTPITAIAVRQEMTWQEAGQYCLTFHRDLLSVTGPDNQRMLEVAVQGLSGPGVWIGLRRHALWGYWYWAETRELLSYARWMAGQPDGSLGQLCGMVSLDRNQNYTWSTECCERRLSFVCH